MKLVDLFQIIFLVLVVGFALFGIIKAVFYDKD
jgi:hypothetical protein